MTTVNQKPKVIVLGTFHMRPTPDLIKGKQNDIVKPEVNEVHQFGFRLASELRHEKVYAVDWMEEIGNIGLGKVFDWAEKHQPETIEMINKYYRPKIERAMVSPNIFDRIRAINTELNIKLNHEMYMTIARIGRGNGYVGIDWVRWWYQRNLTIYANLTEITTCPSDRTLLIIGSAHVHLVTQFLQESGLFDVVPANDYLV
ncbi:DUF5694 domain-containing protein [Lentibacillus salicampi]|uniref:Uncharacterized protein n=1 Tax=Lentibacillus salicampi TaxID=175306 RepID=A0A4Y9ADF6_9BACI|nr:DUF5694 domain-containing protein [Lentibacillus salicampi]TFJ93919.1 hypothetical protein E4U82_03650 [Lentibacillus salicampi]